jgi:hypothetical protein
MAEFQEQKQNRNACRCAERARRHKHVGSNKVELALLVAIADPSRWQIGPAPGASDNDASSSHACLQSGLTLTSSVERSAPSEASRTF